jgi:uncharacterized Zn finger protein
MSERMGSGAWARLFASAVVRDEGSAVAERGRVLCREGAVLELAVEQGTITARVNGCSVEITAAPVPPRIWTAMVRFSRGNAPLEEAIAGRRQSVHLEHLMTVDWSEPLVPRAFELGRACTCDRDDVCAHVAALAYAVALAIDAEPSLLLRWRGCTEAALAAQGTDEAAEAEPAAVEALADPTDERPWRGGPLPEPPPLRPLPVGAVLKRLGPSGLELRGDDLAQVLQRAYESFAASAD